jgi:hypothetical protein
MAARRGIEEEKESSVRKIVLLVAFPFVLLVASAGCTVGVDAGTTGGACEALTCAEALSSGLAVQNDTLCDAASDAAYSDLINCACSGACPECDTNLCTDSGMDGACADCLAATCGSSNAACSNN